MEVRKQRELEWANKRYHEKATLPESEFSSEHSNSKFYSVTHLSRTYLKRLIAIRAKGKVCLDYCCGLGDTAILLSNYAESVVGIDLSGEAIQLASAKAERLGLRRNLTFLTMDAENLDFDANTFDLIVCSGVLHHLDIKKAYENLSRVLKPEGLVVCIEPLKYNPVFQWYRRHTPHLRTDWELEHILGLEDINVGLHYFRDVRVKFFHLACLAAVPFRNTLFFTPLLRVLDTIDTAILSLPGVRNLAWQVVFEFSKPTL